MAKMIEIQMDPDEKTLKQFGFIALVGMGAIAGLAWFELLIFSGGWLGTAPVSYTHLTLPTKA